MKQQRWKGSPFRHAWVCLWHEWHRVHPHPLGQTPENQYNSKMSPKPIQACRSFPNIALFHTRTHTHAHIIKWKKTNGTEQIHKKELSLNSINGTRVRLCSTKTCASILLDVFFGWDWSLLEFCLQRNEWQKLNRANRVCFREIVRSKCAWWCTSLPGAQVSQWTGSWRGWVNEVSPQEDVSVHLSEQMLETSGCRCPVKLDIKTWLINPNCL